MDSNNDDSDDSNNNPARRILMTDMLTIRTSWIRTVHRAAQAYLHQMTSSSTDEGVPTVVSASNITEQDILYAYIWHLLTRTRVRGIGSSISNQDSDNSDFSDNDPTEVVKLFTTAHVCDVLLPAIATVPLHSFFLRPSITDETGIPHLRRYALLALAIRSVIEAAVREPSAHEGQDVARRMMAAKRDWIGSCEGGLCIISLDEAGRRGLEVLEGMASGHEAYGRGRSEVGSDLSTLNSSGEKEVEMGLGIQIVYNSSTPTRGEYHAVVLPMSEGGRRDGKWRVQLHLHPLYRQWLRRWMEENPGEAEIVPRV
ncbi:hypothetical protein B0H65DRAFT_522242 [Neurospora tetraspora]|uniref:Uncharacterized protein n=1 Tax=Neurospora tetraspora TaxID=94610 RepID=A0AAE0MSP9_9PEZI|nr:hypothetical protein B0H65DRAFT_522242 [Neurospora tetraspora]